MSFLAPVLLLGLPLALLPVIIHLIHLLRRKQIPWAAMMFLRKAQKMNKGFSKLRQYLILAFRMLAVAALIAVIARPLAGGLLGLTGGAPDSVIILLDRSASMEEQLLTTGTSKRLAGLQNLTAAIKDAYGKRSKLVLIDSASLEPVLLENADALADVPQSGPTATAADVPALLQGSLDYLTTNETGRTDVWLVSDLRQSDWDSNGGRWATLRSAFSSLQGVRFQILAYPETQEADLSVAVEKVTRRETSDRAELLLDIRLRRSQFSAKPMLVPVQVTVNGIASTVEAELKGDQVVLQAQAIPIDKTTQRGWGSVSVPTDAAPSNNVFHFVFDKPATLVSAIVSDSAAVSGPLNAALSAAADPSRTYQVEVIKSERAAEIAWDSTGLIIWQAPLPDSESAVTKQLDAHVRAGRSLIFMPPETPDDTAFAGVRWTQWQDQAESVLTDWWRSDSGLLAATRAGVALPVGELEVRRWCGLDGTLIPLARLGDDHGRAAILAQATGEGDTRGAYFMSTLPGPDASSLARDGVVMFALLHRALNVGAQSLGNAQQRLAAIQSLGEDPSIWQPLTNETVLSTNRPLLAGVLEHHESDLRVALNRPASEDGAETLNESALDELFSGLDWRLLARTLENEKSLTSEVWRTFLMIMAAALILEALLCLPHRRPVEEKAAPEFKPSARV